MVAGGRFEIVKGTDSDGEMRCLAMAGDGRLTVPGSMSMLNGDGDYGGGVVR